MKTTSQSSRDELDLIIARQVRVQRPLALTHPLPAAGDDEPSDDELLLAVEGRLPPTEAATLEHRLDDHPFSRDRLEILREALAEVAQESSACPLPDDAVVPVAESPTPLARFVFALRRGSEQVIDFIRGSEEPIALESVALATRGGSIPAEALYKFARSFDDCDALIQVERVPGRGVDLRLELSTAGQPITDGRASLRRHGRLVESVRIRRGHADFCDLEPASSYEMEIKREGQLVGEVCLSFLPV